MRALPSSVPLEAVLAIHAQSSAADVHDRGLTSPTKAPEVPFGMIDLPEEQHQEPVAWRLGGSHLAVTGGPRSGRTMVLRTIAQAAAATAGAWELHLYLIDASRSPRLSAELAPRRGRDTRS